MPVPVLGQCLDSVSEVFSNANNSVFLCPRCQRQCLCRRYECHTYPLLRWCQSWCEEHSQAESPLSSAGEHERHTQLTLVLHCWMPSPLPAFIRGGAASKCNQQGFKQTWKEVNFSSSSGSVFSTSPYLLILFLTSAALKSPGTWLFMLYSSKCHCKVILPITVS